MAGPSTVWMLEPGVTQYPVGPFPAFDGIMDIIEQPDSTTVFVPFADNTFVVPFDRSRV